MDLYQYWSPVVDSSQAGSTRPTIIYLAQFIDSDSLFLGLAGVTFLHVGASTSPSTGSLLFTVSPDLEMSQQVF